MAYSGSCHCGAVAFTVEGDPPAGAMSCNCSHCRRKGFLLTFVPAAQFTLGTVGLPPRRGIGYQAFTAGRVFAQNHNGVLDGGELS